MDTINKYCQIIERILCEYAKIPYAYGDITSELIVDREACRYLLMVIGWEGSKRVHGIVVHVDIIDGKVWIQQDGTEDGIAGELMEAGIPKDQIILAWHPVDVRQYTGFAIA